MATKKKSPANLKLVEPKKAGRKTKPVSIWLDPEQESWLKSQPKGISVTVRNMITEAMNLEILMSSAKKKRKK